MNYTKIEKTVRYTLLGIAAGIILVSILLTIINLL